MLARVLGAHCDHHAIASSLLHRGQHHATSSQSCQHRSMELCSGMVRTVIHRAARSYLWAPAVRRGFGEYSNTHTHGQRGQYSNTHTHGRPVAGAIPSQPRDLSDFLKKNLCVLLKKF